MEKRKIKIGGREVEIELGKKTVANFPVVVKGVDKDAGTLEAIFSTQDEDRHGDTVIQDGWDLKPFKKNPVILDSHNYDSAADVIGKASNVKIEGKKLTGKITFAVAENPKAKIIFDLYAGGYLSAFSVGFLVKKFKEDDYWTIEEAELLEVSAVSVPANARALLKSKGFDIEKLAFEEGDECELTADECEDPECLTHKEDPEEDPEEGDEPETPQDEPEAPETTEDEPEAEPEPETPTEEPVATPEPEPVTASYKTRAFAVITGMNDRQRKGLVLAHSIISKMLEESGSTALAPETRAAIHKRKVNQAVRAMLDAKE